VYPALRYVKHSIVTDETNLDASRMIELSRSHLDSIFGMPDVNVDQVDTIELAGYYHWSKNTVALPGD
jgi:hypothetical protein